MIQGGMGQQQIIDTVYILPGHRQVRRCAHRTVVEWINDDPFPLMLDVIMGAAVPGEQDLVVRSIRFYYLCNSGVYAASPMPNSRAVRLISIRLPGIFPTRVFMIDSGLTSWVSWMTTPSMQILKTMGLLSLSMTV
jgi:hypothetical protein